MVSASTSHRILRIPYRTNVASIMVTFSAATEPARVIGANRLRNLQTDRHNSTSANVTRIAQQ